MLMVNHLCGFGSGGAQGLTTLTQVLSSTSTGSTITAPVGIQAGDLLVLWDLARHLGTVTTVVPTDFAPLVNAADSLRRGIISYKIAVGTEGGTNITGMNGSLENDKVMVVYRGDVPIGSVATGGATSEVTDGNPASQIVPSSGGTPPLVVVAGYGCDSGGLVNPRTISPAKDDEVASSGNSYLAWKIYGSSPADVTVDMDDEGSHNVLARGYLACAA